MIPLMMQKDYHPKGWRESWLGAFACAKTNFVALTWNALTGCSGPAVGNSYVVCDVGR